MNTLAFVFILKIGLTLLLWCGPLLLLPNSWLQNLGFPVMIPEVYLKLLGCAYLALVVGYAFGLRDAIKGLHPLPIIWMGIVSNGSASLTLLIYGFQGSWNSWGSIAQFVMWFSMIATGAISLALLFFGFLTKPLQT